LPCFESDWHCTPDDDSDDNHTEDFSEPLEKEFANDVDLKKIFGFNDCIMAKLIIPDSVELIDGFNG
jgi:hypothetical protein